MCGNNDPRRLLRILNLRQGYVELHGKLQNSRHPGLDSQDHIPQTVDCPNVELELRPGGDLMIAVDRLADLTSWGSSGE